MLNFTFYFQNADAYWVCREMSNFAFRRPKADEKTFLPEVLGMHQSKSAISRQSHTISILRLLEAQLVPQGYEIILANND